ncbi:MAG: exosortase system-associated protein, TIGR04073 family [Candidatus Omnitrophica bacterium]|jgi:putative exosortase-associated protein (TIGR04073 family)|nr:exosortase system-associated protein, TIGR04073 family [Candidatus Omnitrophota bacterium]
MKKTLCILVAAAFIFSSAAAQAATVDELMTGMGHKAWRGIINLVTGWVEIPAQIVKGYQRGIGADQNNKVGGAIVGIFTGVVHASGRTLSGAGDIVSFWAADPESNEGIGLPLEAEYAWGEGEPYNLFDPSFGEATAAPILKKFGRGIGNTLFGFAEVPGQIAKGIEAKALDLGIFKGLWYSISREIDGCFDLVTFLLPGPVETKALPFDEKWPWSAIGDKLQVKG